MANRNEQIIDLLSDAIDKLDLSEQILTEAQATTDPETRIAKLTPAIAWHEETLAALRDAQVVYQQQIQVRVGVGEATVPDFNNLYIDIYSAPDESYGSLNQPRSFTSEGVGYTGSNQTLELTITGRYKARDNSGNFRYWYRVEFNDITGWITDNNRISVGDELNAGLGWIQQNKPIGDPMLLPEQDRDGTPVYTIYYNGAPDLLRYAPLQGNISLANLRVGILRLRAFAENSVYLVKALFEFFETRIHYLDPESQQWTYVTGWIEETRLPPEEVSNALQVLTLDRTTEYAGRFDKAVSEGRIPLWQMPPPFSFYPVSVDQSCDLSQPATAVNIDGVGIPYDPEIYGTPPYHMGTDFYAPEDSYVYSIAPNGLVVGIGVGNNEPPNRVDNTAYDWGSAILDDRRGYSVIIRYGHLYVLYGHLQALERTIFVGAPLGAGERIGRIGRYNDSHVHIEVRNFNSPIGAASLQAVPLREYGFVSYSTTAAQRAQNHYDIAQFFPPTLVAWSDDTATSSVSVSGFSSTIVDGTEINLGNCIRTFRVKMDLQTIQDTMLGVAVRGLVQGVPESQQSLLIPPSSVPTR